MKDQELLDMWGSYDKKLEGVLSLNEKLTKEVTKLKINTLLSKMKPYTYFVIALGVAWIILLMSGTVLGVIGKAPFFAISIGIITIINIIIVAGYIRTLVILDQIDKSQSVIEVQDKLAKLKASNFSYTRIAFLQTPFWASMWMSFGIFSNSPWYLSIIPIVIFLILCYFSYWIYRNLTTRNMDKKWMKFLFSGIEWDPIVQAEGILEEIEELKN